MMPDDEYRTDDSKKREEIYDKEISPLMKQLIDKCKEHKMPLFIECEFNPGDFCKTCVAPDDFNPHPGFITLDVITQCFVERGVNVDKYLMWLCGEVEKAGGHGSIYLSLLGYDPQTGKKREGYFKPFDSDE
jgi:hypothetical protein